MGNLEENLKEDTEEKHIYVVGIGASAGGLEALQDFFKAMPSDTGVAFVVVQHLSPDHKSLMDELLSRCTAMPVKAAVDAQEVLENHVYLIPPGKNLSIFKGKLYLQEQRPLQKVNLAIDSFFRSLATDKGKHAIAVVLSGAGSDGTLGIRAIKEEGGMVIVQDAQTAKFDSMPQNSIATGLVDYVLPPCQMAEAIVEYLQHPYISHQIEITDDLDKNNAYTKILSELRNSVGMDFSAYKENSILRRLERRVSVKRFASLEEYLPYFLESEEEKNILYKEFLIGVTSFFRDKEAFACMAEEVLPQMKPTKETLRFWSVACSTGEEAYSLAMMVSEYMQKEHLNYEVKIFATDIDKNALNIASQGFYPDSVVSDIDPELLLKYFVKCDGGYRVTPEIRKMLIFSEHNILRNPPFSKLDLIVCRNLFIYLKPMAQQELLSMFYYALNSNGFLFIGCSESVGEMGDAFHVVSNRWKIYSKSGDYMPVSKERQVTGRVGSALANASGLQSFAPESVRIEKIIEQAFSVCMPPSVIIDAMDNIIHMENDINQILVFRSGKFSTNLFANLPNDVGLVVNGLLHKIKSGNHKFACIRATGLNGFKGKDMVISGYMLQIRQAHFYLISFETQESKKEVQEDFDSVLDGKGELTRRIRELEQELQLTKESLQATVEELETSNEELQSSNEEMVASNEELQSTNEELQSVNEELYTVNSEYQAKINELVRLNNDLDNLLKNTEVGALYLDNDLKIRKLTPRISEITNIRELDIGRPIAHIALMEGYIEWLEDIKYVQKTLKPIDKEISDEKNQHWLVRVRPYRSSFNSVEGIIMTFIEITALHKLEIRVTEMEWLLHCERELGNLTIWEYHVKTGKRFIKAKEKWQAIEENIDWFANLIHKDDKLHVQSAFDECIQGKREHCHITFRKNTENEYHWIYLTLSNVEKDEYGEPAVLRGTIVDIDKISGNENLFMPDSWVYSDYIQHTGVSFLMNERGNILHVGYGAEKLFGSSADQLCGKTLSELSIKLIGVDGQEVSIEDYPFYMMKRLMQPITGLHYQMETNCGSFPVVMEGRPFLSPEGKFEGAVVVLRSII